MSAFLIVATAFNLICSVTYTGPQYMKAGSNEPANMELSIDTEGKRWCFARDECRETMSIHEVTDAHIILIDVTKGPRKERTSYRISRESGSISISERAENGTFLSVISGPCEKAPFTGFPQPKF